MKTSPKKRKKSHPSRRKGNGWQVYLLIVLIIVMIPVVYYGCYVLVREPIPAKVWIIAHRGGTALAPENTLTAFTKAAQVRADGVELDIQLSKDGNMVVMHDVTVDRMTNGKGYVKNLNLTELRDLTVRGELAGEGERIPTFSEVLALAKQNGLDVFAEIKKAYLYPGIEAKMIQAVRETSYESKTKFLSFEAQALEKAASLAPEIPRIALYGLWQFNLGKTHPGGAKIVAPMAEMVILYPWMVKQAHSRGELVFAWTGMFENRVTINMLRTFGVDGMIVNNPSRVKKILN